MILYRFYNSSHRINNSFPNLSQSQPEKDKFHIPSFSIKLLHFKDLELGRRRNMPKFVILISHTSSPIISTQRKQKWEKKVSTRKTIIHSFIIRFQNVKVEIIELLDGRMKYCLHEKLAFKFKALQKKKSYPHLA